MLVLVLEVGVEKRRELSAEEGKRCDWSGRTNARRMNVVFRKDANVLMIMRRW